jgi:hypothetical protein
MQKTVAISTLQSLVSEHNKPIYQEALDCIKKELTETLKTSHNKPDAPCCMYCGAKLLPALACPNHGFYGDPPK